MIKEKILIFVILILISCISFSQTTVHLINGTDSCLIKTNEKTISIYSQKYITIITKQYTFEKEIVIYDTKTIDTLFYSKNHSDYFKGIYNELLLLDNGTGSNRSLKVIDLTSNKILITLKTRGKVEIINKSIVFNYPFIEEEPYSKPDCPKLINGNHMEEWLVM